VRGCGECGVGADGGDCVVWAYVSPIEALERDDLGRPTDNASIRTRCICDSVEKAADSLGITRNDPQRRGRMHTPIQ
jgi:hypothetical protein